MRAFLLIFVVLFASSVLWRTVCVRKRDRKAIRSVVWELAVALSIAFIGASALFFALFNNTLRVL